VLSVQRPPNKAAQRHRAEERSKGQARRQAAAACVADLCDPLILGDSVDAVLEDALAPQPLQELVPALDPAVVREVGRTLGEARRLPLPIKATRAHDRDRGRSGIGISVRGGGGGRNLAAVGHSPRARVNGAGVK
jgi:hypothetical protein